MLALTRAAERLGVTVRHGRAIGLRRDGARVTGVVLEREVLSCVAAVLAIGPWSAEASQWIGVPIDVRPLKGQILRLQAPGPPIECSVGWGHNYSTTKTDGLLWAGTTEEEAGFDEESTLVARDEIGDALVKMLPAMADAQVAQQTACYFHNQLLAAQHHYFEWNNPGYARIPGYEEYLKRQTADVGVADAGLAARRATQPIGTPDEIIEKIRTLQRAISLEMIVIHFFYGGMPRARAEKSLRLFAEKVLPAVRAMPTPINPASLAPLAD